MGVEIERKFLVLQDKLPELPAPDALVQGYLSDDPAVRVRLTVAPSGAESAFLTIKGRGLATRSEFEYPIPADDARALLGLCRTGLAKHRHRLGRWELDYFPDTGLWLAELELASEDEPFERPGWLGVEVTGDPSYTNVRLARSLAKGVRPG